ncbi:hypothetical protein D9M73_197840 [compost metagenome]
MALLNFVFSFLPAIPYISRLLQQGSLHSPRYDLVLIGDPTLKNIDSELPLSDQAKGHPMSHQYDTKHDQASLIPRHVAVLLLFQVHIVPQSPAFLTFDIALKHMPGRRPYSPLIMYKENIDFLLFPWSIQQIRQ